MHEEEFSQILNDDIEYINKSIDQFISDMDAPIDIKKAMAYSLENGGKRIRPILCIEFAKAFGCNIDKSIYYAVALEFIHTYSLIHDDLPCMDNDDMRRGKPSCHVCFGEALALLAGDGLLTEGFGFLAKAPFDETFNVKAVDILSKECGIAGMVGGQVLDIKFDEKIPNDKEILKMYEMKTARLLISACKLGCLAGGAEKIYFERAEEFGYGLGIAFQIQDDILDIIGDNKKIGKPIGSDEKNRKNTYVSKVGLEKAKEQVVFYTEKALNVLNDFNNVAFIRQLTLKLLSREN